MIAERSSTAGCVLSVLCVMARGIEQSSQKTAKCMANVGGRSSDVGTDGAGRRGGHLAGRPWQRGPGKDG